MKKELFSLALAGALLCATPTAKAAGENFDINYMAEMQRAAQDGGTYALRAGKIFEDLRNHKIDVLGLDYPKTSFFNTDNATNILENIEQYLYAPTYTDTELDWLSRLVYCEAGCDWYPDWVPKAVASVVLNRVASPNYPNSIQAVIEQSGQYGPYITGAMWNVTPSERIKRLVEDVLKNGSTLPSGVIGQSGNPTGAVHSSYYDSVLNTTVYFYY